mmetsp:Transcript_3986/g.11118  ORF Transcript_3986/g.11118 Transcript_3986/m.11118 type:complete len:214 (+) Transcript_3986:795-1436(+)
MKVDVKAFSFQSSAKAKAASHNCARGHRNAESMGEACGDSTWSQAPWYTDSSSAKKVAGGVTRSRARFQTSTLPALQCWMDAFIIPSKTCKPVESSVPMSSRKAALMIGFFHRGKEAHIWSAASKKFPMWSATIGTARASFLAAIPVLKPNAFFNANSSAGSKTSWKSESTSLTVPRKGARPLSFRRVSRNRSVRLTKLPRIKRESRQMRLRA